MKADLEPPDAEAGPAPRARRPEVQTVIDTLLALSRPQLHQRLRQAILHRDLPPEALLYMARHGHGYKDKDTFFLAFEGLTKCALPMIRSQMRRLYRISDADLKDHAQVVFENIFLRISEGNKALDYGERFFHSFILKRSLDAMKSADHPWEPKYRNAVAALSEAYGKAVRPINGDGERAPVEADARILSQAEDPAERAAGQEELEDVRRRLLDVPENACEAHIQSHVLKMTHAEIAAHFDVDERTIRNWLPLVSKALGKRDTP